MLKNVKESFNPGLMISLWRNMIKINKTDEEVNKFFIDKIKNKF